jgi:DNA mismatch endonuclease, patch repair protein
VIDIVDQQTRSRMMSGIKGKNTRPELALRRAIHARGFRYRLHATDVLGRPDLVFPKHNAVVFVHGCFWHRHMNCRYTTTPSTRPEFWQAKFDSNVARDTAVRATLLDEGWRVATVWECALRKPERVELATRFLAAWLGSGASELEISEIEVTADQNEGCAVSSPLEKRNLEDSTATREDRNGR